jgi:hypothetical protein
VNELSLATAVLAALAAACWYVRRLRAAPVRLRSEVRSLRVRLDRLAARNAELSRLLQRSVQRLQLMVQVDTELTDRVLDLDALCAALAQRAAQAVGDAAGVYLPEPGRPAWRALEGATPSLRDRAAALFQSASLEPEPAQIRDAMAMGRPQATVACGLPCTLAVPLRSRSSKVIGALLLARRTGSPPYGPEAIALCELIAERAASALDVARTHQAQAVFADIATRELRAQSRRRLEARTGLDPVPPRVNGEIEIPIEPLAN